MPQLTRGARRALDHIRADIANIRAFLTVAHARVKFNPDLSREQMDKAQEDLKCIERRLINELEPLLERQAPQYEQRLAENEQRLAELEQRITALENGGKVVALRKEA